MIKKNFPHMQFVTVEVVLQAFVDNKYNVLADLETSFGDKLSEFFSLGQLVTKFVSKHVFLKFP